MKIINNIKHFDFAGRILADWIILSMVQIIANNVIVN